LPKNTVLSSVWLFGSYAHGEEKPDSDIDLLIDKGKITSYLQLSELYAYLQESLHTKLDLVTTGALWDDFLEQVTREQILIYDATEISRREISIGKRMSLRTPKMETGQSPGPIYGTLSPVLGLPEPSSWETQTIQFCLTDLLRFSHI
jgi:predicted nucleotidyltransferase